MELEKILSDLMKLTVGGLSEVDQRIENSDEKTRIQHEEYREELVEVGATIGELATRMKLEGNLDPEVESEVQELSRIVEE